MAERTDFLTEETARGQPLPRSRGHDVLSNVLNVFRVNGAALFRAELMAPVAVDVPNAHSYSRFLYDESSRLMVLHIVARGSCRVEVAGNPPRVLSRGCIVGFPHGDAHRISVGEGASPVSATSMLPPLPWTGLPVLRGSGDGRETRLVCLYVRCDELLSNPILDSLPALLTVSPDADERSRWITDSAGLLVKEAMAARPGSESLMARMSEALFIEIVRRHMTDAGRADSGWLGALADPQLARVLACLHEQPQRRWGLDELAQEAGMSRSAMNARFRRVLGMPPMRYLTLWRLQLAARALRRSHRSTAQIAADVGYGSEAALSRAFKCEAGVAPSEWRHAHE